MGGDFTAEAAPSSAPLETKVGGTDEEAPLLPSFESLDSASAKRADTLSFPKALGGVLSRVVDGAIGVGAATSEAFSAFEALGMVGGVISRSLSGAFGGVLSRGAGVWAASGNFAGSGEGSF